VTLQTAALDASVADAECFGTSVFLCRQLQVTQRQVSTPRRFDQVVADALKHIGFGALLIGEGAQGEILVRGPIAAIPRSFVVDAQPSASGVIERQAIRWGSLAMQRQQLGAQFVVVIGETFEPGLVQWAAHARQVPLIDTRLLCALMLRHAKVPLTYAELWSTFAPAAGQARPTAALEHARRRRVAIQNARLARPSRTAPISAAVVEAAPEASERDLPALPGNDDGPRVTFPHLADEEVWRELAAPMPRGRRNGAAAAAGLWWVVAALFLFVVAAGLTYLYLRPQPEEAALHAYRLDVPAGSSERIEVRFTGDAPGGRLRVRVDGQDRGGSFTPSDVPVIFAILTGSKVDVIGEQAASDNVVAYQIEFPTYERRLRGTVPVGGHDIYYLGDPR
jgi:hypothetical protein